MRSSRSQMPPFARHWPGGRPSATAFFVATGILFAFLQWSLVLTERPDYLTPGMLTDLLGLNFAPLSQGLWWQHFTYFFLHPNPLHLCVNMIVLAFAGREVEPISGLRHFSCLYLGANVLGGLAQRGAVAIGSAAAIPMVGASAGAGAVLVAWATILPELEIGPRRLHLRARFLGVGIFLVAAALWLSGIFPETGPAGLAAGSLLGWIYARLLGFGTPLAFERWLFDRRQHEARLERMPAAQFIREELDPILEKISREGARSLTRAERRLLEKGRAKLSAQPLAPAKATSSRAIIR